MNKTAQTKIMPIAAFEAQLIHTIHCIGVGGIGVSGLADCCVRAGYQVTGSDAVRSDSTDYLIEQGVSVTIGHDLALIEQADCVIYSRAVLPDHPERQAAEKKGIPLYSRGECLALLLENQQTLVISGSHGKSTTSGWLSYALSQEKKPINKYLGAKIRGEKSTISFENGWDHPCVLEGDESDGSCFLLSPTVLIITNIDADHLENYDNSLSVLQDRFVQWVSAMPAAGCVIVCRDDVGIQAILPALQKVARVLTYGFHPESDFQLLDFTFEDNRFAWRFNSPDAQEHIIDTCLPGRHNGLNGLAAWVACLHWVGKSGPWQAGWSSYPGVNRRMMVHGAHAIQGGEALIIEDYGHHPTELQATFSSILEVWPERRLVVLFQPHRYSRTKALLDEFVAVLSTVDCLHLLPIYSASEIDDLGVSSQLLSDRIVERVGIKPVMHESVQSVGDELKAMLMPGDVLLLQGAGTVGALAAEF